MKRRNIFIFASLVLIVSSFGVYFVFERYFNKENHSSRKDISDKFENNISKETKKEEKTQKSPRTLESSAKKEEIFKKPETIEGVAIGEKHKINFPHQIQKKWFWCAPTTVSMILSARGKNISQDSLSLEMGTYEPFGTHNKDAIRVLNRQLFGYDYPRDEQNGYRIEEVRRVDDNTIATFKKRLIKNTNDGYPIYYTVNPARLYSGVKNSEHNVAGAGYIATPDGKDVAFVYFVDPYPKFQDTNYGGLKIATPRQMLEAISDKNVTEPYYAW